jgi:hypothetical protein
MCHRARDSARTLLMPRSHLLTPATVRKVQETLKATFGSQDNRDGLGAGQTKMRAVLQQREGDSNSKTFPHVVYYARLKYRPDLRAYLATGLTPFVPK